MMTPGPMELGIILAIVVVLFGAGRLAGIGSGIGKGISNFKNEMENGKKKKAEELELKKAAENEESDKDSE
ncbi:MAG: twin-arginine translocase TatA/TatE family subunit [Deltaproteobacteria bacterium]|jgi:sec-independent protein translocase protein TatA|nr:twin-arginine translocase TatA/TatE family subunit [Deltaproteobacteria bacterium]MBT4526051.1 twin-arginine translocase TatA/TatE family subunit [Deltaproteobacteria bacterium]